MKSVFNGHEVKNDLDLPPMYRTSANFWKAEYLKLLIELQKANRGIKRLKRKIKVLENEKEV